MSSSASGLAKKASSSLEPTGIVADFPDGLQDVEQLLVAAEVAQRTDVGVADR
jgi:hypothetical protein